MKRVNTPATSAKRMVLLSRIVCIACLLLLVTSPLVAAETKVSARLTPHNFSTQQPARLAITIEGKKGVEINIPDIDGLLFHERGQSSQFQMTNGTISSSVTYTYLVQGIKPGDYTIPPITVTTREGTHKTEPILCSVTGTGASPHQRQTASSQDMTGAISDEAAFIKLLPGKERGYVGELIPTTIKAYFNRGVKFKFNALPELTGDGILMDALSNEPTQQEEIIDGKPFIVLTWNTMLTGIKEGKNGLHLEMDVSMLVRTGQQRRMPGFGGGFQDDFFDDLFARWENQPIKVVSPEVSMSVSALPEQGKPDQFSGAIGSFTLDIQAQPIEIDPGDPITVTMSVSGTGNFDNVSVPLLSEPDGIKVYSPTSSFEPGNQQTEGRKTFEQAIVVTDLGINQIPSAVFSYFDPHKEQYQTLFSDPVPIISTGPQPAPSRSQPVKTSAGLDKRPTEITTDQPLIGLAPIKLTVGTITNSIRPTFRQPLYLIAAALLISAIFGMTGYRVRNNFLAKNPAIVHQRNIENEKKSCINELQDTQSMDDRIYLETARQKLSVLLALIWGGEATSITTSDVKNHLGNDHPITTLFYHNAQSSYGTYGFSKTDREQLHNEIIKRIPTLS